MANSLETAEKSSVLYRMRKQHLADRASAGRLEKARGTFCGKCVRVVTRAELEAGDVASPQDFRDRIKYQFQRFNELLGTHELTPQWKRFGQNYPEQLGTYSRREALR
jgi:hypothetical protein